ncbi:DUF4190 domain-containing protein [Streptomyces koyangensis]
MAVTQSLPGSARAERDNRAARVSLYAVIFGAFVAGGGYVPAALFFPLTLTWMAVILLSGVTAIVAGHLARFRAKRHGRRLALAGIVGGWICVLVAVLALAAVVGVVGGLAVLIDS